MQPKAVEIQFTLHLPVRSAGKSEPSGAKQPAKGRLPRITQVMSLAVYFQDLLQRGEARDYADLARLGRLTRERMSQIMELVWLAPDMQQQILEFQPAGPGRFPVSEVAMRRIASTLSWEEQRQEWNASQRQHHIDGVGCGACAV